MIPHAESQPANLSLPSSIVQMEMPAIESAALLRNASHHQQSLTSTQASRAQKMCSPKYAGYEDELEHVSAYLSTGGYGLKYLITGMAGIGKSELAKKFVYDKA